MNVLSGAKPRHAARIHIHGIYMSAYHARCPTHFLTSERRYLGEKRKNWSKRNYVRRKRRWKNFVPSRKPTTIIRQTNEASARHWKHWLIKRSSDVAFNLRQSWRTRRELRRVSRRQSWNPVSTILRGLRIFGCSGRKRLNIFRILNKRIYLLLFYTQCITLRI